MVDSVLKEMTEPQVSPSDDERLATVEVLLALNHSPVYKDWLIQLEKTPLSTVVLSAVLVGWALREEVESNLWESSPRVSNEIYTNALRQVAREMEEG